jgi:UDP-N-acetylmuramoyl-L-alanyl-D-glutamate--2,6-diaminopimelate ligase
MARAGDVVILAGKGHERTLATREGPVPWDEAASARGALAALGYSGGTKAAP